MEKLLYIILVVYFLIGALLFIRINKTKTPEVKKNNWLKYFTYLILINGLFLSILFNQIVFHYICFIIILGGFYEIISNTIKTNKKKTGFLALVVYTISVYIFYYFSLLPQKFLFYTLFMIVVFDGFSQLAGQLFGKKKMLPKISPNKTYAGLIGGLILAIITSILIRNLLYLTVLESIVIGFGIAAFAFIGDVLASFTKRKLKIKDFSKLIPGHGGFLDRFDSLIFGSIFIYIINSLLHL